jgi:hypothetical protein
MDTSDNYFYKLEDAQKDVQYLGYLLETIRVGVFTNGRLQFFCESLANRGNKGWVEFIDSIITNPSIPAILNNAKKKLGHTFKSIEEVYRTMILIVENNVFEEIVDTFNNISSELFHVYGDNMPIKAGKDQTNICYYFDNPLPYGKDKDIIRHFKVLGFYSQYHMTVTPDMIVLKL